MTARISRKPDPRFTLWKRQPRAGHLTRRDREIAKADHAYAEALRLRTEPARIDALIAGRGRYKSGKPCPRCRGVERRVSDRACWSCWQRHRPQEEFNIIRRRGIPPASCSVATYRAQQAIRRRSKAGEYHCITVGDIQAHEYPDGRLEILEPPALRCPDLRAVPYPRLFQLAHLHPSLVEVMRLAGWSV